MVEIDESLEGLNLKLFQKVRNCEFDDLIQGHINQADHYANRLSHLSDRLHDSSEAEHAEFSLELLRESLDCLLGPSFKEGAYNAGTLGRSYADKAYSQVEMIYQLFDNLEEYYCSRNMKKVCETGSLIFSLADSIGISEEVTRDKMHRVMFASGSSRDKLDGKKNKSC